MANPNKLESGTIFGATYKIIDFIGEGGMGLVYKVEHLLMAKLLALKILKTENLTEAVWKRFRAEGQAIARLDHSNIVRIYDMSQSEDGVPFYTMDLLIGQSLADYLQENRRLSEAEALPIFRQVCAGLAYAHERGIIHRDIKPGNIMLIDRAEADKTKAEDIRQKLVKIVDFGIAKLTDESGNTIQGLTKPGEVFGSPLYMSPEQCNGQKVDQRSDLYSVGITLFQALTGKPPLLGKTAIETTIMHQTTKPARLNDLSDQVEYSPRLEALVAKMLEKRPQDRYSSLAEVAKELLEIERSEAKEEGELLQKLALKEDSDSDFGNHWHDGSESQTTTQPSASSTTTQRVALLAVFTMLAAAAIASAIIYRTKITNEKIGDEIKAGSKQTLASKQSEERVGISSLLQSPREETKKLKIIPAPKLDQTTQNKVENFIESTKGKLSTKRTVGNERLITFNFPAAFSYGILNCRGPNNFTLNSEAQNKISVSDNTLRKLRGNDIIRAYPQLLTRLGANDLWSLTIEGQTTDPGLLLTNIANLTGLYELTLTNSLIPCNQLANLNTLSRLKILRLATIKIDGDKIAQASFLKQLQHIDLENCDNILPLLQNLKQSSALEKLVLNKCTLSDQEIKALSEISCLKKLILSKSSVSDDDLKQLTHLSRIEELDIEKCSNLDSDCLRSLKAWPKLNSLKISKRLLEPNDVEDLQSIQRQRKVDLTVSRE
ncbi:MAG: hypothetical protein C0508_14030 [Cyanobacteria bacterium PR.023]|nr:hypothetical protein [Cyanobacteria bacterium PR.023]